MKKVFAIVCAVLVMMCTVIPCFAWGDMGSPDNYGLPVTGAPVYANYEPNTEKVMELVAKAVKLDKFGGLPVAKILYHFSGDSFVIVAMCPAVSTGGYIISSARDQAKNSALQSGTVSGKQQQIMFDPNDSTQPRSPFVTYVLQHGGDWAVSGYYTENQYITTSTASITSGKTMWKNVAYWSPTYGAFRKVYNDSATAGQGLSTGEYVAGLDTILEVYDEALEKINYTPEPVSPNVSYQLDIAAIFDGYFAGVRDTLGAFDINLFGINVIGVLIAFIVIAVVAFIVRKLWK